MSRATDPLTRMFPFISRDDYDICTSHGSLPRLSFHHYDVFCLERYVTMTSSRLPGPLGLPVLLTPNPLSDFLSLYRLDVVRVSYFYGSYACLYLYLQYVYIYWVGDGTIPIFNLLCNHPSVVTCEIPRTLARPL